MRYVMAQKSDEVRKVIDDIPNGMLVRLGHARGNAVFLHSVRNVSLGRKTSQRHILHSVRNATNNKPIQQIMGRFSWQEGFGAFSYGKSQISDVCNYIETQKKRHGKLTFREEYLDILKKFDVEYDERYIFKDIDE